MAEDKSELLSSLLGMLGDNPEEKIKSALSSLGNDGEEKIISALSSFGKNDSEKEKATSENEGFSAESLLKLGSIFSSANEHDDRAGLLNALKPFLSDEKKPKVDSALKLLKLAKIAETAQKNDIFKNFKL